MKEWSKGIDHGHHPSQGSLMPPLLLNLIFTKIETSAPFIIKLIAKMISANVKHIFINPNLKNHFDFLEGELSKSQWFAGNEFTAADIMMSFPIEGAAARGILKGRPKLEAWLEESPVYDLHTK